MLAELEAAVADSLRHFTGARPVFHPPSGAACANCGAPLQGRYCHFCGQDADSHKRSILRLVWEGLEGLLHLDGRLRRTAPDLFLRPGRLARDYMENRIARHAPPFRTFLVALVIFIFAAEHAAHELQEASARDQARQAALLATPQGRAKVVADMRREAASDRESDLSDAARDRASDLKDPDENHAKVEAAFQRESSRIQARYAAATARADRVAAGLPAQAPGASHRRGGWWREGVRKATENPSYYWSVLFTWAHRAAILLLPIVGLTLAGVYRDKPQYFLYDHLLVAMNLLSFAFLANAVGLILPPPLVFWWLGLVALWTPVNLFQTLRGAYGSTVAGAFLKTLAVWLTTVVAFGSLLIGLLVFTLTQL
ncbi:MAG TPA: DUF3667 domain-containing protein [Caulobacteraceae bacterium]|jgi:hypothetical protein|nr:DUF3667 domain-containing protein [Caulobacteraceae bacterium]